MKSVLVVIAFLSIWPWSSGGETYRMAGSSVVPAATASVKAQRSKENGNTKLNIKVQHLAKPSSLTPPASVYLVWARPRGGTAVNVGAIGVNHDLAGELKTVTVLRDFELLITAEQSETTPAPSGIQVFHTYVSLS